MKVLHVSNGFWPCVGGIERVSLDSCIALKKIGVNTSALAFNGCHDSKKIFPSTEKIHGIEIERVPVIRFPYYPFSVFSPNRFKKFDVIHVHGIGFFSDFFIFTKFLHKKPVVVNTHGGFFHTKNISFLKKIYFNFFQKFLLKKADLILADSDNDFNIFSKIVPKNKIKLFFNGVNVEKFLKLGKKKAKSQFVFVGRLSKNKRIDLLLDSMHQLSQFEKNFKLFIVGKDFDFILPELKQKVKQLKLEKNVNFLERVSDEKLLKLFSDSQFFISSSEYEGFGVAVIEAMAASCVPVLSPIQNFKVFVQNNKNGFIVNFFNPIETGKFLAKLLKRKNFEKVSKSAKSSVLKFSINSYARNLSKIYNNLVQFSDK